MRWMTATVAHSMQRFFQKPYQDSSNERKEIAIDNIRFAMLEGLGEQGAAASPTIRMRVAHANDLMDLWYLRGDLMAAIAALHGEIIARKHIEQISTMFHGLLPKGLTARTSSLRA